LLDRAERLFCNVPGRQPARSPINFENAKLDSMPIRITASASLRTGVEPLRSHCDDKSDIT
jgi:hypothetical protein